MSSLPGRADAYRLLCTGTLRAHPLSPSGSDRTDNPLQEQVQDSNDFPSVLAAELWAPVGAEISRYRHHLFPQLHYHALPGSTQASTRHGPGLKIRFVSPLAVRSFNAFCVTCCENTGWLRRSHFKTRVGSTYRFPAPASKTERKYPAGPRGLEPWTFCDNFREGSPLPKPRRTSGEQSRSRY